MPLQCPSWCFLKVVELGSQQGLWWGPSTWPFWSQRRIIHGRDLWCWDQSHPSQPLALGYEKLMNPTDSYEGFYHGYSMIYRMVGMTPLGLRSWGLGLQQVFHLAGSQSQYQYAPLAEENSEWKTWMHHFSLAQLMGKGSSIFEFLTQGWKSNAAYLETLPYALEIWFGPDQEWLKVLVFAMF